MIHSNWSHNNGWFVSSHVSICYPTAFASFDFFNWFSFCIFRHCKTRWVILYICTFLRAYIQVYSGNTVQFLQVEEWYRVPLRFIIASHSWTYKTLCLWFILSQQWTDYTVCILCNQSWNYNQSNAEGKSKVYLN